jgi:hypothetical protein
VSLENRYFLDPGLYGNNDQSEVNLVLKPEYSVSWDDDRKVVTVSPFVVLSNPDSEKEHWDIREAVFVGAFDNFELRAGVSKVFWGVTESSHLVDVINQTDLVLNSDGEDKLGQPMINTTFSFDIGTFDLFVLPYFRERTFPGAEGRFRTALTVDRDNPLFEDDSEQRHIDVAARYSHTIEDLDFGVSYFKGTNRDPGFVAAADGQSLRPFYAQIEQMGLDAQLIIDAWLIKLEAINKTGNRIDDYVATTAGFEYTFSNIKSTGLDVGVLLEYLYDERGIGQATFYRHVFAGTRLALNDDKSTELLMGALFNVSETQFASFRLEGSRRINENWKWEVEGMLVGDNEPTEILHNLRSDDYLQFSLSYFY